MARYDNFISFGVNCQAAYNIERVLGPAATMPFDWWNTPLFAVAGLLESEFSTIASRSDLVVSADRQTVTHRRHGIFLHHDFPRDEQELVLPLTDVAIEAAAAKYARRAALLMSVLRSDRRKLIIRYDAPGVDEWMRFYIAGIWREGSIDQMINSVLAVAAPSSCDFLFVNSDFCPELPPILRTSEVQAHWLTADPEHTDWRGNISGWERLVRAKL